MTRMTCAADNQTDTRHTATIHGGRSTVAAIGASREPEPGPASGGENASAGSADPALTLTEAHELAR